MITKREFQFYIFIFAVFLLAVPPALAQTNGNFDPGNLVADESFSNYAAFDSADGVQRFLEIRGSILADNSLDFLRKLKEPADIDLKNKLEDPNPSIGRLRTAAELIYDAAQVAKINPQVILATLNKEQSLIDGDFTSASIAQRRLDRAMGFACPDAGVCGDLFLGFYFQLFGNLDKDGNRYLGAARSLSKSFYYEIDGARVGRGPMIDSNGQTFSSAAKIRSAKVNDVITVDNTQGPPNNAPATSTFTIKNAATAALYRYTPHVYNGNYNFWNFFKQWFKYANGSLIKLAGTSEIFYVDNGERRPASGTVLGLRKLDVTRAFSLSQKEFDEYPLAKPLPPPEGTLLSPSTGGVRYLVEDNVLHKISDFVAGLRKLDINQTIYLPDSEVITYETGTLALPPEGTLWKNKSDPVIYLIQDKTMRPISGFVFKQRGYKFTNVVVADDVELIGIVKGNTLPPLDGTLVKAADSPLIYYVALGQRFPIPGFVFKLRNYKFSQVVTLGTDEIENLALAQHLAPQDGTLLKAKGDGTVYLIEASSLHYLSGFMFQYRGYKFKSVVEIKPEELALIPTNSPVFLPDDSIVKIKGDATVYLLQDGNKLPMTYNAFTERGFKFSAVIEITQAEADRYPTGLPLTQ